MKKDLNKKIQCGLASVMMIFGLTSCGTPSYPATDVIPGKNNEVTLTDYETLSIAPVNTTLGSDYIRGIDASEVKALEELGIKFYDSDNVEKDVFTILKNHGVNWIRLRIWNDYTVAENDSWGPYGFNNLERTINMAQRAVKNDMKILLDFHYSDNWADPSKQYIPEMWKSYVEEKDGTLKSTPDVAGVKKAVCDYTADILNAMKAAGCMPSMVQLGNEMQGGIFKRSRTGATKVDGKDGQELKNLTDDDRKSIIAATAAKVKSVDSNCQVMIHMSNGGNEGYCNTMLSYDLTNIDVIGLSYYPFYTNHGTMSKLQSNIERIIKAGKKAVIAETSYCYDIKAYTDNVSNEFYTSDTASEDDEVISAVNLTDYSGITTDSKGNKRIVASIENQAGVIREIIEKTASKGASGVFYWGACYLGVDDDMPSSWENQTLFDANGKVLPSLDVMAVSGK